MPNPEPLSTGWLMNLAAKIAYLIRTVGGKFDRSQLFRLLEVLEATPGDHEAMLATAIFAMRQAMRREIPQRVAEAIRDALLAIKEAGGTKGDARNFMGYLRWFFDATERARLPRNISLSDVNAEWLLKQLGRRVL